MCASTRIDGFSSVFMVCLLLGFSPEISGHKKTAVPNQDRRSMKSEENFLFGLFTHTSLGVSAFANHRGISPSPVGTLTRPMRSQEFLMLQLLYYTSTAIPSCKCVIKSNVSGPASQRQRATGSFQNKTPDVEFRRWAQ